MKAILGRKVGMTQVFATDGTILPVTVIEVLPNTVMQKKTIENDGYEAVQLGIEDKKEKNATKAEIGHAAKANTSPKYFVREVKGDEMMKYNVGDKVTVDIFQAGELVDVTAKTKGHGFTGAVKRWNNAVGPRSHGSGYHRGPGSLAVSGRYNNTVRAGMHMPGHYGYEQVTTLNLTVVAVDVEKNALLVKGSVPGAKKSLVTIRSAVKVTKNVPAAKALVDYSAKAE
jgi:large subunit ribosomal protein L3